MATGTLHLGVPASDGADIGQPRYRVGRPYAKVRRDGQRGGRVADVHPARQLELDLVERASGIDYRAARDRPLWSWPAQRTAGAPPVAWCTVRGCRPLDVASAFGTHP